MKWLYSLSRLSSTKKGAIISLIVWLLVMGLLSGIAKPASNFATNVNGAGLPEDVESMIAQEKVIKYFKDDQALPAIFVYQRDKALTDQDIKAIQEISKKIEEKKYKEVKEVIPFDQMPAPALEAFQSEDKTTMIYPLMLKDGLQMNDINEVISQIKEMSEKQLPDGLKLNITGPAGIASDAIAVFSNADLVLLFSTVGLILVLLIVIYRSPLLAIIPLIAAGILHQIVNQFLGLLGENGLHLESQSLSIMSILLFAALTDYALFVFSRFKEELKKEENKYIAMQNAMKEVSEPILFSGSTVLVAMLLLFAMVYEPYRNFAPVFSITMVFLILAGLTLLPALFTLFGRKAFWPFIPKVGEEASKPNGFWWKSARLVTKKPGIMAGIVALILLVGSFNFLNVNFSFNLVDSFPEDMDSRAGYQALGDKFSPGDLATTTVIVEAKEKLDMDALAKLREQLSKQEGVAEVTPDWAAAQKAAEQAKQQATSPAGHPQSGGTGNMPPAGVQQGGAGNMPPAGVQQGGTGNMPPAGVQQGGAGNMPPAGVQQGGTGNMPPAGVQQGGAGNMPPAGVQQGGAGNMPTGHPGSMGGRPTVEDYLTNDGKVAKLELTFKQNPYEIVSLEQMDKLREKANQIVKDSGLESAGAKLYFAGETAKSLDVKKTSERDTLLAVILVTIFITVLLGIQTRSLIAPLYMILTILLSYLAAMGISLFIFENFFGYDSISYRVPLYTFVFLVALGVDYNIILMSRIKEELRKNPLKTAVVRGLALTGGVISSAGLILAATFAVLTTQPFLELFLFGFMVALGILIDTFLVRTILVPAVIVLLKKWSFWPKKLPHGVE